MTTMTRAIPICFVLLVAMSLSAGSFAADEAAIKERVDGIAVALDGGKAATDYKPGDYDPYVFIMEEDGMVVSHPSLQGQSLNTDGYRKH